MHVYWVENGSSTYKIFGNRNKYQGSIEYTMKPLARRLLLFVSLGLDHSQNQAPAAEIRRLSMDKVVFLCNLHCIIPGLFFAITTKHDFK